MENFRGWKGLHVIFLAEKFVAVLSLGFGSSIKIINFIFVTNKENFQAIVLDNIEVSSVPHTYKYNANLDKETTFTNSDKSSHFKRHK